MHIYYMVQLYSWVCMLNVKPVIIFLMGCALTSVLTWSSYEINVNALRNNERKIITEITTQLQINLNITIGESIMPIILGTHGGMISPESFHTLTDPILEISPTVTSIGWVPMIKPEDRESFVEHNSLSYTNFTMSIIGPLGGVLPRPIDNVSMWPLLHANPVIEEGFRGVDLYYGLWKDAIDLMVKENRTIISDLVDLQGASKSDKGVFTNQKSVYQLLQPVFDLTTYQLIGTFNRLFFPSVLVRSSLETTSINDIDVYQISLFRINDNGYREDIYIETSTGDLMTTGKNLYREVREINNNIFITELITETVPRFETYGIILLISFFASIVVSRMYIIQMNTSKKDKVMSIKYKKATDMKSTFLAEMSHELRTPLNGIIGTIDILTSIDISPEIREYLHDIKSCGDLLITLITGILDFSKIEAGKVSLDITSINIGTVIHDTTRVMVQSFNDSKNVDVILKIVSTPSEAFGDEIRIRQIFMNMLSNALKFTETGSVIITVSSKESSNSVTDTYLDGKYEKVLQICMVIEDTGIGVSSDRISDLFQPFSQIKGKSSVGGTGLGLIITKTLCESMNGSVSCSSVYTKGSCFSCEFIVGIPTVLSMCDNDYSWNLIGDISGKNENKHSIDQCIIDIRENVADVLVVDDVLINIKVAEGLFALYGIKCHTASDGVQAIELCGKNKYKMILMDYYMPGMSGVDVAVALRGDNSNPNIDSTIICLTASHTKETVDSIMSSGMDGYELKPIRKSIIEELCKKYIYQ